MVTVYIWEPGYLRGSLGHASMVVDGGDPPGRTYISWWPEKSGPTGALGGVRRAVHSSLDDDMLSTAEGRPPDHRVRIAGLDETKIKMFWKRWLQQGHYHGTLFNCATTVAEALKEGGGDRYEPRWGGPLVWKPSDVLAYATAIQARSAKSGRS